MCGVCGCNVCVGYVHVYVWSVCIYTECLEMHMCVCRCVSECVFHLISYHTCLCWVVHLVCMLCVLVCGLYVMSVLLVVSKHKFQWKYLPACYQDLS